MLFRSDGGVERIQYLIQGGATPQTHYCSASFENATWHSHAIYEALKARPNIRPDLVVAHSGPRRRPLGFLGRPVE